MEGWTNVNIRNLLNSRAYSAIWSHFLSQCAFFMLNVLLVLYIITLCVSCDPEWAIRWHGWLMARAQTEALITDILKLWANWAQVNVMIIFLRFYSYHSINFIKEIFYTFEHRALKRPKTSLLWPFHRLFLIYKWEKSYQNGKTARCNISNGLAGVYYMLREQSTPLVLVFLEKKISTRK